MAFILGVLVPNVVKLITKNNHIVTKARCREWKSRSNLVRLRSHSGESDQNVVAMGWSHEEQDPGLLMPELSMSARIFY